MRLSVVTTALAFAALALPALAQSEEAVMEQIETIHGESEAFGEAFGALQDSFLFDDPAAFADLAFYPLPIRANGEEYEVLEPEDLVDNFEALLTAETRESLASQDFDDLIVTGDGVGFANGALWMTLVCIDEACDEAEWGIIAINN